MAYDYDKTHENILDSARRHFTEYGFRNSSIRLICKDAGVTNGAFYAHFKSKEDLFGELVEPVLNGFDTLYGEESRKYQDIGCAEDVRTVFRESISSVQLLVGYVYEHADVFRLLLTSSGGTAYEGFLRQFTEAEVRETMAFFELCRPYMGKPENITENIARLCASTVITSVFEGFLAGRKQEEVAREAALASDFCIAGFSQVLGL